MLHFRRDDLRSDELGCDVSHRGALRQDVNRRSLLSKQCLQRRE